MCVLCVRQITFLSHVIDVGKISLDPAKMAGSYTQLKKESQSLSGSINFVATHIPNQSTMLNPLHLKTKWVFIRDLLQTAAFTQLEKFLAKALLVPVLSMYNPKWKTFAHVDMSLYGPENVLLQEDSENEKSSVVYRSRTLTKAKEIYNNKKRGSGYCIKLRCKQKFSTWFTV